MNEHTVVSLDVMGGDHAPQATIEGGLWAARDFGITVQLVGIPELLETELLQHDTSGINIEIVPATEVIGMDEQPSLAVKRKKDSSMVVGVRQVKEKKSHAFVTAGNSGAAMAAGLFGLGRIKGLKRPALGSVLPTGAPKGTLLLDVGANTEVRPEYLVQFAVMGSQYAKVVMKIDEPRVGLLSVGEEEAKGNQLIQDTIPLLRQTNINFVGNIEGKDIPPGKVDVAITDGFTGNVFLKGAEGVVTFIVSALEEEIKARPLAIAGAFLARGAFKALKKRFDYREMGGAPLLGVNGVVIVAHGRSDAYAIRNAIRIAKRATEQHVVELIATDLKQEPSGG